MPAEPSFLPTCKPLVLPSTACRDTFRPPPPVTYFHHLPHARPTPTDYRWGPAAPLGPGRPTVLLQTSAGSGRPRVCTVLHPGVNLPQRRPTAALPRSQTARGRPPERSQPAIYPTTPPSRHCRFPPPLFIHAQVPGLGSPNNTACLPTFMAACYFDPTHTTPLGLHDYNPIYNAQDPFLPSHPTCPHCPLPSHLLPMPGQPQPHTTPCPRGLPHFLHCWDTDNSTSSCPATPQPQPPNLDLLVLGFQPAMACPPPAPGLAPAFPPSCHLGPGPGRRTWALNPGTRFTHAPTTMEGGEDEEVGRGGVWEVCGEEWKEEGHAWRGRLEEIWKTA